MANVRSLDLDLDLDSRRALDFDELLDLVASHARTAAGVERVRGLQPIADAAVLGEELAILAEFRGRLERDGTLLPSLPDARPALAGLAVDGLRLDPLLLRALARVVAASADLRSTLLAAPPGESPRLAALGRGLADLAGLARPVLAGLDTEGHVLDTASPQLAAIRRSQLRTAERLRGLLGRLLHEPGAEPVIRDSFITQRNGRFVIPMRSDSPRPLGGIVHASSSSGATRFVEPFESVELNNELLTLTEREQEEEERILLAWSEDFRRRAGEVRAALAAVTLVDALQARALYARDWDAVGPTLAPGGPLEVAGLRHPLLERRLRDEGVRAVPLDLVLDPADQVLVLSGPNTGGKTVALKSVGLAVLMAQSAIPVTADRVRLPPFGQVRADIGDHQSIAANLSTFSAHVRAVVRFLGAVRPPALFLFDEIGTGTEPAEGAALAQTVLEALLGPGITALATTHLTAIKAWAATTAGARGAAMEFDTATLQPTYRIQMGAAGVSAGLDIAERLGLPRELVERARARVDPGARRLEEQLERLRTTLGEVEELRGSLAERERALVAEHERVAVLHAEEEKRRQAHAARVLDQAVAELRERGKAELERIHDVPDRARAQKALARTERRLAAVHDEIKSAVIGREDEQRAHAPVGPGTLARGAPVFIASLQREGRVLDDRGEVVDVQLGGMTLAAARSDLRTASASPAAPPARGARRLGPAAVLAARARAGGASRASRSLAEPDELAPTVRELMLLGKTVDEALEELDRFLDAAMLSGQEEVRIVHGHGTGRLRTAVRTFLRSHVHVQASRPGEPNEGGDGATVVLLKE